VTAMISVPRKFAVDQLEKALEIENQKKIDDVRDNYENALKMLEKNAKTD